MSQELTKKEIFAEIVKSGKDAAYFIDAHFPPYARLDTFQAL